MSTVLNLTQLYCAQLRQKHTTHNKAMHPNKKSIIQTPNLENITLNAAILECLKTNCDNYHLEHASSSSDFFTPSPQNSTVADLSSVDSCTLASLVSTDTFFAHFPLPQTSSHFYHLNPGDILPWYFGYQTFMQKSDRILDSKVKMEKKYILLTLPFTRKTWKILHKINTNSTTCYLHY